MMIKKVFASVLLALVFGLLILGAVNRTIAKSDDNEPLALSEGTDRRNGTESGYRNSEQSDESSNSPQLGRNNKSSELQYNNQTADNSSRLGGGRNNGGTGLGLGAETPLDGGLGVAVTEPKIWADPITVTVETIADDQWLVSNNEGFELEIGGRALGFLQDNDFKVEIGNELVLVGFYEGDRFELGEITNNVTQQELALRDETGRPFWSGRYR
ncbi:MAG: hypothetical protein RQ728_09750 [Brevefilum sp.]|nr:hypothetical protein [Brevefilum sp.]